MDDFMEAVEKNLSAGNYYSALFLTIMIPSICGALQSKNGNDSAAKYINWFDKYVDDFFIRGDDCYRLRCSLLHQASTIHPDSSFSRILFTFPHPRGHVFHNNNFGGALNLDISLFCRRVLKGVDAWLNEVRDSENYKKHIEKIIKTRKNGLAPFIKDIEISVIS